MNVSRRDFLSVSGLAAAGMAFPVRGADVPIIRKAGFRQKGDKLRMAFIGSGGRGGANLNEFYSLGEEIVALCDVDKGALGWATDKVKERCPKVRQYQDFRKMLEEEKDLDAVVVSTPDHMHATAAIAAMQHGCHVYVEKPLVRTFWEAERFKEVAEACGVMTQMGNNGNGSDGQRRNIEVLRSGVLGTISEIHVTTDRPIWPQGLNRPAGSDPVPENLDWNLWLGIAPERPFKAGVYHSFKWRGWFDFGTGALGDIACHSMSFFFRGLQLQNVLTVETVKTTQKYSETYPAATTVKTVVTSAAQKTPITIYWYDGKTCPDPETCKRLLKGRGDTMGGTLIVGDKGTWYNGALSLNGEDKFVGSGAHPATKDLPKTLPRVKNHHWEFAEAIRGGAKPLSHFDHAVPLTEMVLLGCISQRIEGELKWDQKAGRFTNNEAANALLDPQTGGIPIRLEEGP